ncbi:MAG: thioredoxin family protein [Phycisphaerae bacterium]
MVTETINKTDRPGISTMAWFLVLALVTLALFTMMNRPPMPNAAWGSDLAAAQTAARKRGTAVLVEFTTDGCIHCVRMERSVLPTAAVKKAINQFEPVRLHWPENGEIAERYGVEAFPSFLVLHPDGKPISGVAGYVPAQEFIQFLQAAAAFVSSGGPAASTVEAVPPDGP